MFFLSLLSMMVFFCLFFVVSFSLFFLSLLSMMVFFLPIFFCVFLSICFGMDYPMIISH